MAPKQYVRVDRRIRVVVDGDRLSIEDLAGTQPVPRLTWTHRIGAAAAHLLSEGQNETALDNLVATSFLGADSTINRLVVEVPAALAWADWERLLRPGAQGRVVVRGTASRPAYSGVPLVLPIRALHLTYGRAAVQEWIGQAVGPRLMSGPTTGVVAETGHLAEAPTVLSRLGWPGADIIHVTEPYRWEHATDWFDTLERLTRVAQCRLLVLEPTNPTDRQSLLAIGHRIAGRGGPAVLVAGVEDTAFTHFYTDVLHDTPLDAAVSRLSGACLYGDQGREDGLRISTAGADLYRNLAIEEATGAPTRVPPTVARAYAATWESIEFSTSERDGLYRLAASVDGIRRSFPRAGVPRGEPVRRQVEPDLYDGSRRVPQMPRAPLRLRGLYHLRVGVTDDRTATTVAHAEPLLFERQLWDDADGGIWLEVGVTGIGWVVDDEPVQRLFIPRTGEAPPCWFAVRPIETGVAALRFTLFHNGHVIQSFRLATLVRDHAFPTLLGTPFEQDRPVDDDGALAAALDLSREQVRGRSWHARLEFSTVATMEQSRARPSRALSIVANDIAGKPVLTFKTAGQFEVRIIGNVEDYVSKSRALLDSLAFSPDTGNYRFGLPGGDRNATSPEAFAADLAQLASVGAKLYDAFVPAAVRRTLPRLSGPPDTVQVASILREKVIPWALIYQGKYDPDDVEDDDGQIAGHGTCTALLTAGDADAFTKGCGELPQCLLHPDMVAGRAARQEPPLLDVTVACPGRFWGFRHRIEAPPAQVPPDGTGTAAVDVVAGGSGAGVVLAVSSDLRAVDSHATDLRTVVEQSADRVLYQPSGKAELLSALGRDSLAVVYVLSRAEGGPNGPLPPQLSYYDTKRQKIVSVGPDLLRDVTWVRRPIVVLNGCGTAGFTPKATSEFIRAFIDDRGAAAVLGTEASVSEILAAAFGHHFLTAFLQGTCAGDAMLVARRALLALFNPLGLSYTLYGVSELRLAP